MELLKEGLDLYEFAEVLIEFGAWQAAVSSLSILHRCIIYQWIFIFVRFSLFVMYSRTLMEVAAVHLCTWAMLLTSQRV